MTEHMGPPVAGFRIVEFDLKRLMSVAYITDGLFGTKAERQADQRDARNYRRRAQRRARSGKPPLAPRLGFVPKALLDICAEAFAEEVAFMRGAPRHD
jgi:hypothetical protein